MIYDHLDFEKPIAELEEKIEELETDQFKDLA